MLEELVLLLPDFHKAFDAMSRIDFTKTQPQDKISHNTVLRNYMNIHNAVETAFLGYTNTGTPTYQSIVKLLSDRKRAFEKQMENFYKMPLSYKMPAQTELQVK